MKSSSVIAAVVADLRRQADMLERLLDDGATHALTEAARLEVFDPDVDDPPVRPDVDGTREERDWCALLLWGQLWALNVRARRGATTPESVAMAKRAGYRDGRAWNSWSGWRKDDDGARWVDLSQDGQGGLGALRHYYSAVNRALPGDLDTRVDADD